MALTVLIPNQSEAGETRVAIVPAAVGKLQAIGATVVVQSGAGLEAQHPDAEYEEAGASVTLSGDWSDADVVLTIMPPTSEQVATAKHGAVITALLAPLKNLELVHTLLQQKCTGFAMEFIPRISRAQSMDVLSSQANMSGYRAAILAARACPKIFPMMITAAGTLAPARVFVIGAGVAGLQAIATAKRLGAVVEAYDVRAAVKEEVQSLGARFVELPIDSRDTQTEGGYAREQTEQQRARQQQLMVKHIVNADAVITTAAVFGKAPPMLISQDVVAQMRPGSVIIDLAADQDAGCGNCEITKPDEQIRTDNGVTIEGATNLPGQVPVHASQAYANNMVAFLREVVADGTLKLNLDDEIQKNALITHEGEVRNELVAKAISR